MNFGPRNLRNPKENQVPGSCTIQQHSAVDDIMHLEKHILNNNSDMHSGFHTYDHLNHDPVHHQMTEGHQQQYQQHPYHQQPSHHVQQQPCHQKEPAQPARFLVSAQCIGFEKRTQPNKHNVSAILFILFCEPKYSVRQIKTKIHNFTSNTVDPHISRGIKEVSGGHYLYAQKQAGLDARYSLEKP